MGACMRSRVILFRVRWRLVIATLFCAASANTGLAQSGGEEIITDRPDITESAVVVPKASLQVENGVTWTNDQLDRLVTLCQTLLRLGVSDRAEFRLSLPSYSQDFSRGVSSSGVTDTSIGFKQQLGPLPGGFDLSLIVATSVPTGTPDKTSHRLDPFLKLPWSRELGKGWSVGGMASIFWTTEESRRNRILESTFEVQRDLSRSLEVFAEYAGDYPEHGGAKQTIHFGTAYRINPTNQVDFHFGFGLSPATPQRFFAIGYSFRIDRLWGK
jgi:hypothetical protein